MPQTPPVTIAYLPFFSTQDWASDPELMAVEITKTLVERVNTGLALLRGSDFGSLTDSKTGITWGLWAEDLDDESAYAPFEPEYTLLAPDIRINNGYNDISLIQFVCQMKHSADEGWCELHGPELAAYADKAWVESFGYVFVQLPDGPDGTPGKWLCVDPDGPDQFQVQCDDLMECIKEAADWLEADCDEDAPPRPELPELRKATRELREAA